MEFVYLIHAVGTYRFKIGRSKEPQGRVRQLAAASPVALRLVGKRRCRDAVAEERKLHEAFASARKHGEWFELDARSLPKAARALQADVGLHYTKRDVIAFVPGDTAWISWGSTKALEVEVLERDSTWYTVRIKKTKAKHYLRLDEVRPDPISALINRVTL